MLKPLWMPIMPAVFLEKKKKHVWRFINRSVQVDHTLLLEHRGKAPWRTDVLKWSLMSDSVTVCTVTHQAHLSIGFFKQEYCGELPFPTPWDLPNRGIEPVSLALAGRFFTIWATKKPKYTLLLLLSHFSRVRLCATPKMAAHQAPPPLGFSRQEHWSGLPFPSRTNTHYKSVKTVQKCIR